MKTWVNQKGEAARIEKDARRFSFCVLQRGDI